MTKKGRGEGGEKELTEKKWILTRTKWKPLKKLKTWQRTRERRIERNDWKMHTVELPTFLKY